MTDPLDDLDRELAELADVPAPSTNGHGGGSGDGAPPHDDGNAPDDRPVGPARFFAGTRLLYRTTMIAVAELGPIVTGPGRSLWRYHAGVYLDDGADEIRRRVQRLLGERCKRDHVETMVDAFRPKLPFITDRPGPPEYINCRNGLLEWRTEELHPHTCEVPTTYQLSVPWQPDASCPTVDDWLALVAPPDAIELLWEIIGVAVYADQPWHKAVLLLGTGRNGKGTLLRLIRALIGDAHVAAVGLQDLAESRWAAADLFGKVANIAGDLDARAVTRTDVFKRATGGDLLMGEHKYGQLFRFTNRATMLFAANEPPGSADHSHGYLSRFVVIPFDRMALQPGDEDPAVEAALLEELPGVLVQAVAGLCRALARGQWAEPPSVIEATARYARAIDPIATFLADCLDVTGDHNDDVDRSTLYARYGDWCRAAGYKPLGANRFWRELAAHDDRLVVTLSDGRPPQRHGGHRIVLGVQLREVWQ